jgi:hypothetical protein
VAFSNVVNSFGLVLDIIGAVLLWKYGLPESISREGHSYLIMEQEDEAEKLKAARYDRWAKVGLGSIIVGFALQLASNFMSR